MANSTNAAHATHAPDDLIPAYEAAKIVLASAFTLARWAAKGLLREFTHPARKCRFYSRAECEKLRPRLGAPRRPTRVPKRRAASRR